MSKWTLVTVLTLAVPQCAWSDPEMLPRDWAGPVSLRQVAIVANDGEARLTLTRALRDAGAEVQVVDPAVALADNGLQWKSEVTARTVILLGGIHTNRAMLPLYANYLSLGDAAYPGEAGFVIRTIAAPFGPGTAAVALEASTADGETAAVSRFAELLAEVQNGSLPRTLEAHLSQDCQRRVNALGPGAMRYVLGGKPADGAEGVKRLLAASEVATGFARHGDYGIERYVREYGHVQDAPGVAPADVATLDQRLLATAVEAAGQWWRRKDDRIIGGRHQTMGTSCFAAAVHLLRRRGNPNDEARKLLDRWWSECETYWRNACSTFHDDLEGYPSLHCPEPTLDWSLIMGFEGYAREQLPLAVLRTYAVTDNLGYYAGTGTYEECRPGDVYKRTPARWLLGAADYFHPGQGYGWLRDHVPDWGSGTWGVARRFGGARTFAGAAAVRQAERPEAPGSAEPEARGSRSPAPPEQLLGVVSLPLGPYRYAKLLHDRDEACEKQRPYLVAPEERCFEKLCFRDNFEPNGQYFVLQGFQAVSADNQPPLDANSLIRYTDLGHVWLHANSERQGNLPRSAVFCSDGLNDSPQPAGCELQAMHSGAKVGLAASHLPDYVACDWTRNLIWRRGAYFVVIDLMRQNREGKFGLTCTFRTPQKAELTPDGLVAREDHAEMHIRSADAVRLSLDGGHELEGAAVPTLLRESQLLGGEVGDVKAFRNLVFTRDPDHPASLEIRPLGTTAALVRGAVRGEDELALVAASPRGGGIRVGDIVTDAQVLYLGTAGWAQAGGTGVGVAGTRLDGSEGAMPPAVAATLTRLWDQAAPAARPATTAATATSAMPRWRFDGFSHLPPAVAAPVLTCALEGNGVLGSLLDGVVTRGATYRWPAGGDVTLTLDLRESLPLTQIDFHTGVFGKHNTLPDPALYPAPRTVVAEFSDDGFVADSRRKELRFTSDCTFENCHKGVVYPILRWTCRGIDQRARHVRLTFSQEQWPGTLGMNELSLRTAGQNAARIVGLIQRDVDGDGTDEVLAWTDQSELAVIRLDGTLAMRKQFPGFITSAECYPDLTTDGPRLLVTTREARLYCLKPDGTEVWKTNFLDSQKLNGDLPTAYSIGLLQKPDGSPLIVTGNYNLATFVSPAGEVLKYQRLPAAYQTMTLSHGFDYNGDGREEIVSTEVWGTLSLLDADMTRSAGARLPRGKGLKLDYWKPPTPDECKAIVCTDNGAGLIDLKTLKYDWQHSVKPISDCVVADVTGDGKQEVVLAKEEGYVLVYDEAGELMRLLLIGEPVRAVAAAATSLVVALPGRLVRLDLASGDQSIIAGGEYRKLAPASDEKTVLAVGEGAVIEALEVK